MIIVNTINGQVFVNEKAYRNVSYVEEDQKVFLYAIAERPEQIALINGIPEVINGVESVAFCSDTHNAFFKYDGSEIKFLEKKLEERKKEIQNIISEYRFQNLHVIAYDDFNTEIKNLLERNKDSDMINKASLKKILDGLTYELKKIKEEFEKSK